MCHSPCQPRYLGTCTLISRAIPTSRHSFTNTPLHHFLRNAVSTTHRRCSRSSPEAQPKIFSTIHTLYIRSYAVHTLIRPTLTLRRPNHLLPRSHPSHHRHTALRTEQHTNTAGLTAHQLRAFRTFPTGSKLSAPPAIAAPTRCLIPEAPQTRRASLRTKCRRHHAVDKQRPMAVATVAPVPLCGASPAAGLLLPLAEVLVLGLRPRLARSAAARAHGASEVREGSCCEAGAVGCEGVVGGGRVGAAGGGGGGRGAVAGAGWRGR